jgi:hypothetical protein
MALPEWGGPAAGGLTGILTGLIAALGIQRRVERLEREQVSQTMCELVQAGLGKELVGLREDVANRMAALKALLEVEATHQKENRDRIEGKLDGLMREVRRRNGD